MSRLKNISKMVESILVTRPETRDSDNYLYAEALIRCARTYGYSLDRVDQFFRQDFSRKGIPTFESVSRCRRKIQEEHPELRPTKQVQEFRLEREDDFMQYAMNL